MVVLDIFSAQSCRSAQKISHENLDFANYGGYNKNKAVCDTQFSNLLPRSGHKKREFGLWVAGAAHVRNDVADMKQRGNMKEEVL
jgi:hypothetical protein